MAASVPIVTNTSAKTVENIFDSMEYGPAPEADNVAQAWLEKFDRKLGFFIDGKWVHPPSRKTYTTKNPCNGQVLATTLQGDAEDVQVAVGAARKAFNSWSELSGHVRARHIYSIARHLQKHTRLMAVVGALDNGKTIRETRDCDVPTVVRHLYYHAGWAQLMDEEMKAWKPVGVIGAIVPWNFPLMLMAWKVCPALAMGNTVVLKPATYTRLTALLFAEICAEAGLPAGVLNVVTGPGSMGSKLALHPDVDKVAFTGSTEIGKVLRQLTAGTGKKLSLELGGKNPVVVFESADLDSAVEGVVDAIWFNQGQVCSAGSKLLVQEPVYNKFVDKLKLRLKTLRVGSSLDKALDMGAIVDESQRKSVAELVDSAVKEGAQVYQADAPSGCFYPPTLITDVQTTSRVVVEEIFGPVLVVLSFRTAKEAISLSNDTIYGLAASVWSEKLPLALETAKQIKAGTVWINCHNLFDAAAGFGGYKQSGFGRDGGKEGLFEYVKPRWEKKVQLKDVPVDMKKWAAQYSAGLPDPKAASAQLTNPDGSVPRVDRTYKLYYGGAQKRPDGNYSRGITDSEGRVVAQVGESNRKDVRNAVEAAQKAQPAWSKRSAFNRAQILYYIAENLELRRQEMVQHLQQVTGCCHDDAVREVDLSIERLFYWAARCDKFGGSVQETQLYGTVIKIHEPVGVVGIACPSTHPLLGFVSLFAPAVCRGNAVVIIPSEPHPTPALNMYQVFETSDVPAGVINVLTGSRDHISKYLVEHHDVQAMWYFGSVEGSKFVEFASADNVKRTWVSYGEDRDWHDVAQGQGEEFLYHSVQAKNVWLTMGDIFAN